MKVSQIQRIFSEYLYSKDPSDHKNDKMLSFLNQHGQTKSSIGLDIYRANLIYSVLNAVRSSFPCIEKALGTENFSYLCREFAYSSDLNVTDINFIAKSFVSFVKQTDIGSDLAYLFDLTYLEYLQERVPKLCSEECMQLNSLQKKFLTLEDDMSFRIRLLRGVRLTKSNFPILKILKYFEFEKVESTEVFSSFIPNDKNFALDSHYLIVYRCEQSLKIEEISKELYAFLTHLRGEGLIFSDLIHKIKHFQSIDDLCSMLVFATEQAWLAES